MVHRQTPTKAKAAADPYPGIGAFTAAGLRRAALAGICLRAGLKRKYCALQWAHPREEVLILLRKLRHLVAFALALALHLPPRNVSGLPVQSFEQFCCAVLLGDPHKWLRSVLSRTDIR